MKARLLGLLVSLACADEAEEEPQFSPRDEAMAAWKDDPIDLLAQCARQPFDELRITCLVQAAANLGRQGEADKAEEICTNIDAELWRSECHFRAGEELGRAGRTIPALEHCASAGRFGHHCLTHTAWNLPPDPALTPSTPPDEVLTAGSELLTAVDRALVGASDGVAPEGHDVVMAQFGYNLYVGSGQTDPGPAQLESPLGTVLRTGFAIEAIRLMKAEAGARVPGSLMTPSDRDLVRAVISIWRDQTEPLTGAPLSDGTRVGRYISHIQSPFEGGSPYVPLFGGGKRLVGETAEEDLVIAALEALFWFEDTHAESFLVWIDDPRPRVRWTAIRLARLTPPATVDLETELSHVLSTHLDENVRWHADDGIEHRSWNRNRPSGRRGRE